MDIKYILKDFIRTFPDVNKFIENRLFTLDHKGYKAINTKHISHVISYGIKYNIRDLNMDILKQVHEEYNFDDIQQDDVVLDVGANRGYFSIYMSKMAEHVYSVEPFFIDELNDNIAMNQAAENITVFPFALSNDDFEMEVRGRTTICKGKPFNELLEMCGTQIDFLKCDCEGGEWNIKPDDLSGIRRIEMEIHSFNGENMYEMVNMIKEEGFNVIINDRDKTTMLLHAFRKLSCGNA